MNTAIRWLIVSASVAGIVLSASKGLAQTIAINSGSNPIQVTGMSGGEQKDAGCAGYIAAIPNHRIEITEDSDLKFVLQAAGQPTLLIRSSTGQDFCVPSDTYSGGKVEIPGHWSKGIYDVFVGDRNKGQNPYTLSISHN
ncbi:hypothetical protein [Pantanalinema sp. GBBB05]|uniref:hypothetical protein n=1 Tax=Pantanalinema sp. GBBB05 TaxID=2604139 RepID=UPI001D1A9AFC|nr:hypothetical protein [Pantanalinema sp. GBBB05]